MKTKDKKSKSPVSADPMEYTINRPLTFEMIISILTLFLLLIGEYFFGRYVKDFSLKLSLDLQTNIKLDYFSKLMNYGMFFGMYLYVLLIFLTRRNSESSFVLLFYSLIFQYVQNILKLFFRELRPLHHYSGLNRDYCFGICDYGMPSGHTLCTAGLLLMLYFDVIRHNDISKIKAFWLRIVLTMVAFFIGFSRIYIGVHTLNQIFLGYAFGAAFYFIMARNEPWILKFIIWPLLYKDRFGSKSGIQNLLLVFFISNISLLSLWAYNYTYIEQFESFLLQVKKCNACMMPEMLEYNFSSKIVRETQIINFFYGMFIGISIRDFKEFRYRGLYHDNSLPKFFLRLFFFLLFGSPMLLLFVKFFNHGILILGQALFVSLVVGYGFTKWYFDFMLLINLLPPVVYTQDENSEMEEITREEELIQASIEFNKRSSIPMD